MKKLLLTSSILFTMLATPAFAQDCATMIKEFDATIEKSKVVPESKAKAIELRMQGVKQQTEGNEDACKTALTAAFDALGG